MPAALGRGQAHVFAINLRGEYPDLGGDAGLRIAYRERSMHQNLMKIKRHGGAACKTASATSDLAVTPIEVREVFRGAPENFGKFTCQSPRAYSTMAPAILCLTAGKKLNVLRHWSRCRFFMPCPKMRVTEHASPANRVIRRPFKYGAKAEGALL